MPSNIPSIEAPEVSDSASKAISPLADEVGRCHAHAMDLERGPVRGRSRCRRRRPDLHLPDVDRQRDAELAVGLNRADGDPTQARDARADGRANDVHLRAVGKLEVGLDAICRARLRVPRPRVSTSVSPYLTGTANGFMSVLSAHTETYDDASGARTVALRDEIIAVDPSRVPAEVEPWLDQPRAGEAPTAVTAGFYADPSMHLLGADAWIAFGATTTTGIGDLRLFTTAHATLRIDLATGEGPTMVPFGGVGESAPRAITRTSSGAVVLAVEYAGTLTIGSRSFDGGGPVLVRAAAPAALTKLAASGRDRCAIHSKACLRCLEEARPSRPRCFDRDLACRDVLAPAEQCACLGQLTGASDEQIGACFDRVGDLTDGDLTVAVIRDRCAAHCF